MALMDHNTKGTKQGNIKHAPKTRPITPAFHDKMLPAFFFFSLCDFNITTGNLANLGSV
jgi:hypothetical protein